MAEGTRETKHPSGIDLLQRFTHRKNNFPKKMKIENGKEEEDIELILGLSLNGRFGVDPERAKNLVRSSSISNLMSIDESRVGVCLEAGGGLYGALTRTCSLPTETEEDWRKRKELQSHRRMEAKRKRVEKLKNVRVVRERIDSEEENGRGGFVVSIRNGEVIGAGDELKGGRENCGGLEGSQGSIVSQGSGSSGVSDFESQPTTGTNKSAEARSPARAQSLPQQVEQKPLAATPGTTNNKARAAVEMPSIKVAVANKEANKSVVKNMMVDMPCVSTRGEGPNGKRIEGFLYRYRKGEEVKIVCVCHGSFLSPAEFVKHAGGGDVAHPLRHIVVSTSPSTFF